jgi:2'-5' RNA ligase
LSPALSETARVFFALWPDAGVRRALVKAAGILHGRHGGRQTRPDSIHLTLVFVGQVDVQHIPGLLAMAEAMRVASFDVEFDTAECWRHNHIGCLGASRTPENLLALVEELESGLKTMGIPFDRRPYKPHITLLRKADCRKGYDFGEETKKSPALQPVGWPARDFVLVKSSLRPDGTRYEELGRWPLL